MYLRIDADQFCQRPVPVNQIRAPGKAHFFPEGVPAFIMCEDNQIYFFDVLFF